jgi:predicted RNA binding protein YcfA (HicA-like mRNA interferase family)
LTRLPILDFRTIERVLLNLGFERVRTKGSHVFYRHGDGRTTTVPFHSGRDIARPLLREILKDIELSGDDLLSELDKL